jgi:hypothetical protein
MARPDFVPWDLFTAAQGLFTLNPFPTEKRFVIMGLIK